MTYYAVIDTNVFISALLSKNSDAATVKVLRAILDGRIVPLYHNEILAEYDEVLHRKKFHFQEKSIQMDKQQFNMRNLCHAAFNWRFILSGRRRSE